jgi:SnoaL-like domain
MRCEAACLHGEGGVTVEQSLDWAAAALGKMAICEVRKAWAFNLDLGEWDALRACFHPDASITVSWYSGPVDGFIERSKAMTAGRKAEEHRKHWLGNMRCEVKDTRAVLETDVLILIREFIDGSLFDYTSYARFYDLFERRAGAWRIREWNCIYDKDRLDPVVPAWDAAAVYAQVVLEGPRSGFAFMALRQSKRGRTIPDEVVIRDTEAERKLRRRGEDWLTGAVL